MSPAEGATADLEPAPERTQLQFKVAVAAARIVAALLLLLLGAVSWTAALLPWFELGVRASPPPVPEPQLALLPLLRDTSQLRVDVTEAWRKIPLVVDAEDLFRDPTLWNRMNFDDWDRVPEPLRRKGLDRMVARYRRVTSGPRAWVAMQPRDWDTVPQPVRAMAFVRIAEHRADHYGVGAAWGVPAREAADTLAALIMVESWFEHRAVNVDVAGNRDLGLPQASDYFRDRLEALYRQGRLDFHLDERDYFNPWLAILAGAAWLDIMITEAGGDLDVAIRAYRKGIDAARRGEAADYAQSVLRKRSRYIRNSGAPPTWSDLFRRLRRSSVGGAPDFEPERTAPRKQEDSR
jgi:hypothetical protein